MSLLGSNFFFRDVLKADQVRSQIAYDALNGSGVRRPIGQAKKESEDSIGSCKADGRRKKH